MIESLEKRGLGSREGRLTWLRWWQSPLDPPVGMAPSLGCAWLDGPDPPGGQREKANTEVQIKQEGDDIIIISSPDTDDRTNTSSDMTVLRQELFSLQRQSRSYLRQLCFWVETVAKLGGELNRVQQKVNQNCGISWLHVGIGHLTWPPQLMPASRSWDIAFQICTTRCCTSCLLTKIVDVAKSSRSSDLL